MAIVTLITIVEADAALIIEVYPEWHALTDAVKTHHIETASLYAHANWTCTEEDFVTPALSDDAKKAVSLYAEASRAGNLYESVSASETALAGGDIKRLTNKVGSLEQTTEYTEGSVSGGANNPLESANEIFNVLGCTLISKYGALERV